MMFPRLSLLLAACHLAASLAAELVPRATFSEVTSFGNNPTNTKMYLYVPQNLASNPAIVVGLHWCSGSAQAYYQGSNWARLSETYGFVVIYPSTPYLDSNCWDVASRKALTRGGGGNTDSIANMVKHVTQEYSADASRVYVTGISSGAMMTNVMVNVYPDLFAAGIAYAGVPAGCFYSAANIEAGWNSTCSQGQSTATGEHWASIARAMFPGYTGPRPRMQVYHGDRDDVLYPQNYHETMKQYAALFGYSATPSQTLPNTPRSPYTKYVFGPNLQGFLGTGVSHSIDVFSDEDLKWFGFTAPVTSTAAVPTTTTTTLSTSTRTTAAVSTTTTPPGGGGGQIRWGQCGGIGYTGPTYCLSPSTCTFVNEWYSQCL